jgi:ribonucleoside-diphosphate reductase alpha chain
MKITKNDGSVQEFMPNKIYNRIKAQAKGLKVDAAQLFQDVIPLITDKMSSTKIDEIIAFESADKCLNHPDYSLLGGRILMSRQSKLIDKPLAEVDMSYDFFAATTFLEKYSKRINNVPVELPSCMYHRVASYLSADEDECQLMLEELMTKRMNFATPIYTNMGIENRGAGISCNLTMLAGDTIEDIEETLTKIAYASKEGSGIGLLIDPIRSKQSYVKSFNGKAGGVVRLADMVQAKMRFYKQGSRAGSCALYLSLWHKDIVDFLELTLPTGDEQMRTRDLFTAVVINDLFMEKLQSNELWHLFCPNDLEMAGIKPLHDLWGKEFEAEYQKAVDLGLGQPIEPKKLWDFIIKSQVESGKPYVMFKDNANKNNMQRNIGVVKQSNLCVAPNTKILTDKGYIEIQTLENQEVNVWNGEEFSKTVVQKTGENQQMLNITTDSGHQLTCTEYHKFYVQTGYKGQKSKKNKYELIEKRANELQIGDKLIKHELPIINGEKELEYAYENGFYTGDGCLTDSGQRIYLYGQKRELKSLFTMPLIGEWSTQEKQDREYCHTRVLKDKFFIPNSEYSIKSRLDWLAGLLDSDGTVTNNCGSQSLQIASVNIPFLSDLQLMLQTLGVYSKVTLTREAGQYLLPSNNVNQEKNILFDCQTVYRILINGNSLYKLHNLGLQCHRLKYTIKQPNREAYTFIKIQNIEKEPILSDTYCFNEPKKHKGMFNGILTGNCNEIYQVSKPHYTAQCTLGSINLAEHDNLETIAHSASVMVRALNAVIDKNKWSDDWSKNAGLDQRALAIGVAGLADFFAKKKISFESEEAKQWNHDIFQTIYKAALLESHKMSLEQGRVYPAWYGSPYEQGLTYIDGWSPCENGKPIAVLNSLFVGLMPTASSAILLGVFESFEPVTSNLFTRKVGQGEFVIINKYLINELDELGLWNENMKNELIKNAGSIQKIFQIPEDIRFRYKDVWEIPQKTLLELSAIRNKYVDQSQSLNVYHADAKYSKISSALMFAWKNGLKTGVYYTRTKDIRENNHKLAVTESTDLPQKPKDSPFECFGCSS